MSEGLKEKLDIFIITYNRAKSLDKTLNQLLDADSPIKDFDIHIIDNNSSDDTELVVRRYSASHLNLSYEKNRYNIGANANITKAFYLAKKQYVWVLADNDDYNWTAWNEVEQAIKDKNDAIIVSLYECPKYDIAALLLQTTFVPGVIYKTSLIDDTVMGNMAFNISNLFPHLALSTKVINENKKIYIVNSEIVELGDNNDENGKYKLTRGYDDTCHPLQKNTSWITGWANSLHMIKDEKKRTYILSRSRYFPELNSAKLFFFNPKEAGKDIYTYACVFTLLPKFYKVKFLLDIVLYYSLYRIIFFYKDSKFDAKKGIQTTEFRVRLFSFIKIRLFKIIKNVGC